MDTQKLIELVSGKIGSGYAWGAQGEVLTESELNLLIKWFGIQHYHLDDGTKAEKWLGYQVFDCSGLIVWALQQMNLISSDYDTDGLLSLCTRIEDRNQLHPGDLVFCGNGTYVWHVGVYIGEDYVVQAESTAIGVVKTNWEEFGSWNMYGRLKCLNNGKVVTTLQMGSKGQDVKDVQELLLKLGYDLGAYGADGNFGILTDQAIRDFQSSHELTVDGIVGAETLEALKTAIDNINTIDWKQKYENLKMYLAELLDKY